MRKRKIWISSIVCVIAFSIVIFLGMINKATAEIPSTSSYVPPHKDWSVHFSEQMNPATFNEETVFMTNEQGEAIPISLAWNEDYTILTVIAPEIGYAIDQSYHLRITRDVETKNGRKLAKSLNHPFTAVAELPKITDQQQLVHLLKERMDKPKGDFLYDEQESSSKADDMDSGYGTEPQSESSTTNVQVAGIDEGDMIKTDGDFIYFLRQSDIIITSADKENSQVMSSIEEKDFQPTELYIHDNLLISLGYSYQPIREDVKESAEDDNPTPDIAIDLYPIYTNHTTANIYDITDPRNPKKVREVTLDGTLAASRKMGNYLYLLANEYPPYQIFDNPAAEVRPFIKDTANSEVGSPIPFDSMYFFPESNENRFLLIASINLNDMAEEAKVDSYLGASDQMYMSENHLYVALQKFDSEQAEDNKSSMSIDRMIWSPGNMNTEIKQFMIEQDSITYQASAEINGTLINQFAMDERKNTFRVATTKDDFSGGQPSSNNLYTFDLQLNPLGSLEGLAKGERIFSVRFMDDVAYMVTFEQVDPLFVIDLTDAKKPTVLGELKIPGFSNYLHPLDDHFIIGFGQQTKLVQDQWSNQPQVRIDGIKISLFDVSDYTNPIEIDSEVIGRGSSYTELNYNHKALYKHPSEHLYGFPATLFETKVVQQGDAVYEDQSFVYEGAFLYQITPEAGIVLKDTITHQKANTTAEYPLWESEMRRLVSIENVLYTFSYDQMKVYDLAKEKIMQQLPLPKMSQEY